MSKLITAFGEIMLRLSPANGGLIKNASNYSASYGGTESNVLVALSGLGCKTRYISAIPNNAFGDAVELHLHRYGVDTSLVLKKGDILGSYYLEEGFGGRSSSVIYNRKFSEITHTNANSFSDDEYSAIFADCELFHISGISFGLSDGCKELSYKLIEEAKKRNIKISFDCNYRARVWGKYPSEEFAKIAKMSDIVFCSSKDLDAMNITDINSLFEDGNIKYLVRREKELTPDGISAYCSIFTKENGILKEYSSEHIHFKALENIGGGDAFDAGILYSLLEGTDISYAMEFALGCYEFKHTVIGDIMYESPECIKNFIASKKSSKGVIR